MTVRALRFGAIAALLGGLSSCGFDGEVGEGSAGGRAVAVTSAALTQPPDSNCNAIVQGTKQYHFCRTNRSWASARQKCQGVGLDLAIANDATENTFLRQNAQDDSWLGGSDQTSEGVWKWEPTAVQFWQGGSNGTAQGGAYTNWLSGQPNDFFGQDCLLLAKTNGKWDDKACSESRDFICEGDDDLCPGNPNKENPGQCGCDNDDIDADNDGVASCIDQCDNDPNKTQPGVCLCGTPDIDSDGDGTLNCLDACPNDDERIALPCSPEHGCEHMQFGGSDYFFCNIYRKWDDAREKCEATGMQLARIDSEGENDFIDDEIVTDRWIAGTDSAVEGDWRWLDTNDLFSKGSSPVGGAYTNWDFGQPNNFGFGGQDCLAIRGNGKWDDEDCVHDIEQYICEDACPLTQKATPGECGCFAPDIDTDDDGVPNCNDGCPADPNKTAPGFCLCGEPDIDSDGDGKFDCVDLDPGVPSEDCDDAPPGTPCDDGAVPGIHECDGAGTCGDPSDGDPPGGGVCTYARFRGYDYWFCPGPLSWEEARDACRDMAGRSLVWIQDEFENAFVASHISTNSWIGANEATMPAGDWYWSDDDQDERSLFWSGGIGGMPHFAAYNAWASGSPADASEEACGAIALGSGTWTDLDCTLTRGFACEVGATKPPGIPPPPPPIQLPGPCEEDEQSLFPEYDLSTEASRQQASAIATFQIELCNAACEAASGPTAEDDCRNACSVIPIAGVATPGGMSDACLQWDVPHADLETGIQQVRCGLCQDPTSVNDCVENIILAPDPNDASEVPDRCNANSECAVHGTGLVCGYAFVPDIATGELMRVCGLPDNQCPDGFPDPDVDDDLNGVTGPCTEPTVTICADPEFTVENTDWTTNTLEGQTFDAESHFGTPVAPDEDPLEGTQTPCGAPPCQLYPVEPEHGPDADLSDNHPWCTYAPSEALNPPGDFADAAEAETDTSQLVSLDFDPTMRLDFHTNIGAFGLPEPSFLAEAGLRADIDVGNALVSGGGTFTIIDALAKVTGQRCGLDTSESRVTLLDIPFVPDILGDAGGPTFNVEACRNAYAKFEEATRRVNKALRDARELIHQYEQGVTTNKTLSNLCSQIFEGPMGQTPPRGFPPVPAGGCAAETPTGTIARFVQYYYTTIFGPTIFGGAEDEKFVTLVGATEELRKLTASETLEGGNLSGTVSLFEDLVEPSREEITIANVTFFIGPIPCNLEVYLGLQYNVGVDAHYRLDAGTFIQQALFDIGATSSTEVAFAGVGGRPEATGLLGAFAGVGFDVGIAAAKFGIDAELSLANLTVPAHAGAGLELGTELDPRDAPTDLADPSGLGAFVLTPKRYVARATYALNLSAVVGNVLSGAVHGKLKLKFLFFSKSWRKQLFSFDGFCDDGCPYEILGLQGELARPATVPWGTVQMPTPLPAVFPPATNYQGSEPLDPSQVQELFYDSLCTCIVTGDPDRECFRIEDCCEQGEGFSCGFVDGADIQTCNAVPI